MLQTKQLRPYSGTTKPNVGLPHSIITCFRRSAVGGVTRSSTTQLQICASAQQKNGSQTPSFQFRFQSRRTLDLPPIQKEDRMALRRGLEVLKRRLRCNFEVTGGQPAKPNLISQEFGSILRGQLRRMDCL